MGFLGIGIGIEFLKFVIVGLQERTLICEQISSNDLIYRPTVSTVKCFFPDRKRLLQL